MRAFLRRELLHWRSALAVLAGVALALAFPTPGWSGLAWLAPGALLLAALDAPGGRAFRLGYGAGLAFHLIALRWLLHIPFPAGAVAGWLALSAYTALYPALWVWLCWQLLPARQPGVLQRRFAQPEPSLESGRPAWLAACKRVADLPWAPRALCTLSCAAAWVTTEMLAAHLLTGFPWNPLGASQYALVPLIQIASVTGLPGVSFVVVWTSVALAVSGLRLAVRVAEPERRWPAANPRSRPPPGLPPAGGGVLSFRFALVTDLGLPLLALLSLTIWGAQRLVRSAPAGRELKLALVQPSIPQRLIWDPRESTNRFEKLMELSRLALASRPDLLVWPESSLPDFDEAHYRALTNLIATHRAWMVLGADDAERRADGGYDAFNSAFLFAPDGGYVATYRKQRLVAFGEYVPLERWLPFLRRFTPIEGNFMPGPGPVTFELTDPPARFSVLICFEDVFARGARRHVEPDTDFLLNLTNDGWFGESAAQWQQAVNAVFRAVENGVPLVRCTNNGLTCWVDAHGRFRAILGRPDGSVYAPGFLAARLPLPPASTARPPTYYRRHGDRFGWGCAGLTAALLAGRLAGRVSRRESRRRQAERRADS